MLDGSNDTEFVRTESETRTCPVVPLSSSNIIIPLSGGVGGQGDLLENS